MIALSRIGPATSWPPGLSTVIDSTLPVGKDEGPTVRRPPAGFGTKGHGPEHPGAPPSMHQSEISQISQIWKPAVAPTVAQRRQAPHRI